MSSEVDKPAAGPGAAKMAAVATKWTAENGQPVQPPSSEPPASQQSQPTTNGQPGAEIAPAPSPAGAAASAPLAAAPPAEDGRELAMMALKGLNTMLLSKLGDGKKFKLTPDEMEYLATECGPLCIELFGFIDPKNPWARAGTAILFVAAAKGGGDVLNLVGLGGEKKPAAAPPAVSVDGKPIDRSPEAAATPPAQPARAASEGEAVPQTSAGATALQLVPNEPEATA